MSDIKCFFLESTNRAVVSLRRYVMSDADKCPKHWLHNAKVKIDEIDFDSKYEGFGGLADSEIPGYGVIKADDPRWPKACEYCGREFTPNDEFQPNLTRLYRRTDTGEMINLDQAPAGGMWFRDSMIEDWGPEVAGPDGHVLVVQTPGGSWNVDGRANNCDSICKNCKLPYHTHHRPNSGACSNFDDSRPHKCWVRHGDPRAGTVTVDKNGITCGAGAGSIQCGSYHGFLRNGFLVTC